ncbi:OLC1v1009168C1 [Oldenlandia corymbosa var. corymbosa]|uniref:OLC1v1009168C1 n=1 Tax=Oldenlandia corymbosa var. corymbosa TaxID=529605 RepID=A0AAV1DN90_OLDCO|nr:OLC1v1009168C1 [Oldenlandia corymbosa var. corymbosa]
MRHDGQTTLQIFAKSESKTFVLQVQKSDTIAVVKRKLQEKDGIPPCRQRLWYGGKLMDEELTVGDYKSIGNNSTLFSWPRHCVYCFRRENNPEEEEDHMKIFVQTKTNQTLTLQVKKSDKVSAVKSKMMIGSGRMAGNMSLEFDGRQLHDELTLRDYNICGDSTLIMASRKPEVHDREDGRVKPQNMSFSGDEDRNS